MTAEHTALGQRALSAVWVVLVGARCATTARGARDTRRAARRAGARRRAAARRRCSAPPRRRHSLQANCFRPGFERVSRPGGGRGKTKRDVQS